MGRVVFLEVSHALPNGASLSAPTFWSYPYAYRSAVELSNTYGEGRVRGHPCHCMLLRCVARFVSNK